MPCQVFISHCKEDKAVADAICHHLEGKDVGCWIAPRDILPGIPYAEAIIDGIEACHVMVFVMSSHSNRSRHVVKELERAVDRGVLILPFCVENVRPSKGIEYFVSSAQRLDAFSHPPETQFDMLANTVRELLARTERDRAQARPPSALETSGRGAAPQDLVTDLAYAEEHLGNRQYAPCIRECGEMFEKAMGYRLADLLKSQHGPEIRERVQAVQKKAAQTGAGPGRGGLVDLVRLYRNVNLFDDLRKHLTSNLQKTRRINWDQVLTWYEMSRSDPAALDRDDAREMAYWTKVFLYDCELVGEPPTIPPVPKDQSSPEKCSHCGCPLEEQWRFCPQCGIAMKMVCDACHRKLHPEFKICPYCETRVTWHAAGQDDETHRAQEEYRVLCVGAYLDNVANSREKALLSKKRLELGLAVEQAELIERACAPENVVEYTRLVEGVLVDGVITDEERGFLESKAGNMKIDPWLAEQIEKTVVEFGQDAAGPAAGPS